jgi:hypothetical protein
MLVRASSLDVREDQRGTNKSVGDSWRFEELQAVPQSHLKVDAMPRRQCGNTDLIVLSENDQACPNRECDWHTPGVLRAKAATESVRTGDQGIAERAGKACESTCTTGRRCNHPFEPSKD